MADVLVIGGGVIGLSVAWLLAETGRNVEVWESRHPCSGASRWAHGEIVPVGPPLRECWVDSLQQYERLAELGDFDWDDTPVGTLVIAGETADLPALREREHTGSGQWLDATAVREAEPALADRILGGVSFYEGRRLDPVALVVTLVRAAKQAGATIRPDAHVAILKRWHDRAWRVMSVRGDIAEAKVVVLAAGLGSRELSEHAGIPLPLLGLRGRIVLTNPRPPLLGSILADAVLGTAHATAAARRIGTAVPGGTGLLTEVALLAHQRRDGCIAIGASWTPEHVHQPDDLDARILRNAIDRVPALAGAGLRGSWSGTRPCSPDGAPIVDELAPGLYACCGHGGEGFIAGPGTARLLTQLITEEAPFTDPRPFRSTRFAKAQETQHDLP